MNMTTRLIAFVVAAGLQAAAPIAEPGFTSLFNGKDLSGWKIAGPAATFAIRDGAIVANGPASHAYYVGGFQDHRFRNFELKVVEVNKLYQQFLGRQADPTGLKRW